MLKVLAKKGIELTRAEGTEPARGEFIKALTAIVKEVNTLVN